MKFSILVLFGILFLAGHQTWAQTEDTMVVELLYKGDVVEEGNRLRIDRATVYHYGRVIGASIPLEDFADISYEIEDTFGSIRRGGVLQFFPEMLSDLEGKIPLSVSLSGQSYPGFVKIEGPRKIRFNFYTDTIKPVLNFWINVEQIVGEDSYYPMAAEDLLISTSYGEVDGLELILPEEPEEEYVSFRVCLISDPSECIMKTLPIMQKDAQGRYEDEEGYDPSIKADGSPKVDVPDYLKVSTETEEDAPTDRESEESEDGMETILNKSKKNTNDADWDGWEDEDEDWESLDKEDRTGNTDSSGSPTKRLFDLILKKKK